MSLPAISAPTDSEELDDNLVAEAKRAALAAPPAPAPDACWLWRWFQPACLPLAAAAAYGCVSIHLCMSLCMKKHDKASKNANDNSTNKHPRVPLYSRQYDKAHAVYILYRMKQLVFKNIVGEFAE